jgi:pseudouridine kinase
MANPQVIVVGAATIDTKGRGLSSFAPGSSIPGHIRVSVGGVARNVAENLARLGISTTLLSAVGDDASGRRILQRTAEGGVNIEHVLVRPQSRSGAYVVILDEAGSPFVSVDDLDVVRSITPRYIYARRGIIRQADMIVFDANLSTPTIDSLVGLARKYGIPIAADPVSTILAPRLKEYLGDLDLVTPNSAEAQALTGLPAAERNEAEIAAKALVKNGVKLALVTMAELGVCYATGEGSGNIPAIKTDVVDLTGGGDAMTAAIIFGLLNDLPVDECIRLGASAAALTLHCRDTVCPDISLDRIYDQLVV